MLCKSESSWFQVAISGKKSDLADVQVFARTSRFSSFIQKTVGSLPYPAAAADNAQALSIHLLLSFTVPIASMFLLSGC